MKALRLVTVVSVVFVTAFRAVVAATPPTDNKFKVSDLLPRGLQKNPRLSLSIITEMTPEGKSFPSASKDHPVYYIGWDGGLIEEGSPVPGNRIPAPAKLAHLVKDSLLDSGFVLAKKNQTPTVIIHYRWGQFNHLSPLTDDGDKRSPLSSQSLSEDQVLMNVMTRAALVGGVPFAGELMRAINNNTLALFQDRDSKTNSLLALATSDLYFIIASAYDYEAASHGQMKLLWCTKISTDSHGIAMDVTLPTLALNAKSYFGHETDGSVIFHPRLYQGRVDLGDPTVTEYQEPRATGAETTKPAKNP